MPQTMALEQRPRENLSAPGGSGPGLTARELVRRHRRPNTQLSPGDLQAWLVAGGFAEVDDGVLRVTELGRQVAAAFD